MKESLGILIGLLLTDGCVSGERFLIFHNKSEVMHREFRKHINQLFGVVHFTERLELTETAQVYGDIERKILSIAPGALVYGKVTMKGITLVDENERKEEKKRFLGKLKSDEDAPSSPVLM